MGGVTVDWRCRDLWIPLGSRDGLVEQRGGCGLGLDEAPNQVCPDLTEVRLVIGAAARSASCHAGCLPATLKTHSVSRAVGRAVPGCRSL
ncbi:hypothetical protein NDU88_000467 [Pleurodeles waltl]|uniref:Uncharacterized protein n=1 Tax=Pleurodeles waltl TaxID=8319 RepID=A0AAV7N9Q1_PLEWA|nr:hypothetical protein NDU88_000467 [Pleurodeles waltl]